MTRTYRAVWLVGMGGADQLRLVELPLVAPARGEARVKVLATGVGYTDVIMRRGYYPYRPAFPFVPGYEVVGTVDALGDGVTNVAVGQRVAALTVHGGYAEYLYRGADELVPVPDGLDAAEVAGVILNYVTAYQMIHRTAKLAPGQLALVTGASGGVGTALLELLRVHGVRAIGAASARSHEQVRALGATPIEGRTVPVDIGARAVAPDGVDAAFDGIGGATVGQCLRATKRGGILVSYGFTGTVASNLGSARGALTLFVGAPLQGRRSAFYGITQVYRKDPSSFREDLPTVMAMLADGRIRPRIERLGLLEGRLAQEKLEAGGATAKLVLVA